MNRQSDRRSFLKQGIGAGFCAAGWGRVASGKSPNGKIHHAAIGVGGKGWSDVMAFASHQRSQMQTRLPPSSVPAQIT